VSKRSTIVIWDDEIAAGAYSVSYETFRNFDLIVLPHADQWVETIHMYSPVCVLLDNDMGDTHLRGWQVCRDLHRLVPGMPIFCISRNPVPIVVMCKEGAIELPKQNISSFLNELDQQWSERFDSSTGYLSKMK
jgi:FixJ family two-component response regulator